MQIFARNTIVQILPVIRLDGSVLQIKDVARIFGDEKVVAALGAMPIQIKASANQSSILLSEIKQQLARQLNKKDEIEIVGPEKIQIQRAESAIDAADLGVKAKDFLLALCQQSYMRCEAKPASQLPVKAPVKGDEAWHFAREKEGEFSPIELIWAVAERNGVEIIRLPTRFKLQAFHQIWVATRDLQANTELQKSDMGFAELNLLQLGGKVIVPEDVQSDLMTFRAIKSGEALTSLNVKARSDVVAGGTVEVVSSAGKTTIYTDGVAVTGGMVGDTIQVANSRNQELFSGEIIGRDQVLVRALNDR